MDAIVGLEGKAEDTVRILILGEAGANGTWKLKRLAHHGDATDLYGIDAHVAVRLGAISIVHTKCGACDIAISLGFGRIVNGMAILG